MIAMFSMLRPSEVIPPSPKTRHWMVRMAVIINMAAYGPSSMVANAAPIRWPVVPPPIGKFNIWATKMPAANMAIMGIVLSSNRLPSFQNIRPSPMRAKIQPAIQSSGAIIPSAICMSNPLPL